MCYILQQKAIGLPIIASDWKWDIYIHHSTHPITLNISLSFFLMQSPTTLLHKHHTTLYLYYNWPIFYPFFRFLYVLQAFSWATPSSPRVRQLWCRQVASISLCYFLKMVITYPFIIFIIFACRLYIKTCVCICKLIDFRLVNSKAYTQSHMNFIFLYFYSYPLLHFILVKMNIGTWAATACHIF